MNDFLLEAYQQEIERCQKILDEYDITSDEYAAAQTKLAELLKEATTFAKNQDDALAKEADREVTNSHNIEQEKIDREKMDLNREMETMRDTTTREIEANKQRVTWQRALYENFKTALPYLITAACNIGMITYAYHQEADGKFLVGKGGKEVKITTPWPNKGK